MRPERGPNQLTFDGTLKYFWWYDFKSSEIKSRTHNRTTTKRQHVSVSTAPTTPYRVMDPHKKSMAKKQHTPRVEPTDQQTNRPTDQQTNRPTDQHTNCVHNPVRGCECSRQPDNQTQTQTQSQSQTHPMLATHLPEPDLGRSLHKHLMMSDTFVDTEILAILHHTQEIFVPPHFVNPIKAVVNIVLPPCLKDIFKHSQHNSSERREHYFEVEIQLTEWLYALQFRASHSAHSAHSAHSVSAPVSPVYDWEGSMLQFNFNHMGPHDIDMLTRGECRRVMHVALVFLHYANRTIPMLNVMLQQWRHIAGITCQQHLPQLTSQFPNIAHLDPQMQPYFDPSDASMEIQTWVLCRQLDDIHYTGALPEPLVPLPSHIYDIIKTNPEALLLVHKALFAPRFVPPRLTIATASTATCTICFDRLFTGNSITMTHCGHFFCTDCHDTWATQSDECAMCRQSASAESASAESSAESSAEPVPYIPEYDTSEEEFEEEEDEEYTVGAQFEHTWRDR
jgi:hypothetical protein